MSRNNITIKKDSDEKYSNIKKYVCNKKYIPSNPIIENINSVNLESSDHIFTFICSEKNNKNTNNILKAIYKLEDKVRVNVENKSIINISDRYTTFNFDLEWIFSEYKKLITTEITEDLFTKDILNFFKKE